ncbi:hypothetical protein L6164_031454 [Bauhinia variegata]|uniref:Uncharacterized protein n=1 Tax=Bauhinia variegata TaxID=167791 RepID=A0ACB9LG92_BAUVA|nr:hypothetical protein L6164_031454 [Bauhinia variegata]
MNSTGTQVQPLLEMPKYHVPDNEKENDRSTSGNSSSNAPRISVPIHPTINHQNLQKFPNDVISTSSSTTPPNSSMKETSSDTRLMIRLRNRSCMCERRAALKEKSKNRSKIILYSATKLRYSKIFFCVFRLMDGVLYIV